MQNSQFPVKRFAYPLLMLLVICFLQGCIGEDFLSDFVEPELRITNPVEELEVGSTHTFEATYFNNIGLSEAVALTWTSSDTAIATINAQGTLTAIAPGTVELNVEALVDNGPITSSTSVTIIADTDGGGQMISRSGTITTTTNYTLEGSFTMTMEDGTLQLSIADDYRASTGIPGLYLYLSNNPNSINGALEVGAVQVYDGAHSYSLENVGINDYNYLLYWCKPFSVKVGDGEIN